MPDSPGLSAKRRRRSLQALSRDRLADLTEQYELAVSDRRSAANHVDALIRARRVHFGELLEQLSRDELKDICEALDLDTSGREKQGIIDRILASGTATSAGDAAAPAGTAAQGLLDLEDAATPAQPVADSRTAPSPKRRRRALQTLSRDRLAEISEHYELDVDDRRVVESHINAIVRARRVDFGELLGWLSRDELKDICEALDLDATGREKQRIIDRILASAPSTQGADGAPDQIPPPNTAISDGPSMTPPVAPTPDMPTPPTESSPPAGFPSDPPGSLPPGASPKMALRRFALRAAGGIRGRDGAETFARELTRCFGETPDADSDGPVFDHEVKVVEQGKKSKRKLSMHWPSRRVVVDVVDRDMLLDAAWDELLRATLQMDAEPQYVVLTNQRDVRLYDLAKDRTTPRLTIALDELPKYSEAFPFFEPQWVPGTTPKIINTDKITKEVAELVGKVYRTLLKENSGQQDEVIHFTLQCIVAMFAEDVGLLPKEYFTTLLYRAAEKGDAEDRLSKLFAAMSTEGDNDSGIPFFNGGLFTDPVSLRLGDATLKALTRAAEANWTHVDPHIFGSVFQGIMGDAERHASGAHYTAREDIMSVVGPTIVEPWRRRITEASTLSELRQILSDLSTYRVLDPACGSGNFLYVAYRELHKLETEVLRRIYDFVSAQSGRTRVSWASGIRTTNFFGIDINPFAVELAKTTLNIAKKIAFEERKATVIELYAQGFLEVDPSLPLDNLDNNIVCEDALFTEWPKVDAIVGNPPFLGSKKFIDELGAPYHSKLREEYPDVPGLADLYTYWFRRAHQLLRPGQGAGLIANSSIRYGATSRSSLGYILDNDGTIHNAVAQRDWPGEAAVMVSIVNWVRGGGPGERSLTIGDRTYHVSEISARLSLEADVAAVKDLSANAAGTGEGVNYGAKEFFLAPETVRRLAAEPASRQVIFSAPGGAEIVSGRLDVNPRWAVCFGAMDEDEAQASRLAFSHLREHLRPTIEQKAKLRSNAAWLQRWWQPRRSKAIGEIFLGRQRVVACSQTMARPVFVFLSTRVRPTNKVHLFAVEDDYSFGVIQSVLHWSWVKAMGGRVKADPVYRSKVWTTFPWPQEPADDGVAKVAAAAQELRATRDRLMKENGWSLRTLYQSAEVAGPHPLKDAQAALDEAVDAAYGKPKDQEATEFLLEMNLALAEDEAAGEGIQGPGLPAGLDPKDPRWFSTDCIEPPPLEVAGEPEDADA